MKRFIYPVVLGVFFLSGVTGLVYEVVWTRLLTLIFGHTVYAVSTVLAAFMGGLALGSYLFGGIADRHRNPLRLYAVLELGIGLFALAVPFVFSGIEVLFAPIYRSLNDHFFVFSAIRFVVCFLILLFPTILMGGTLPILARAAASDPSSLGARVGTLYAINTLGAVLGCFVTGFVLIEWAGVHGAIYLSAALNLFVAAVAAVLATAWVPEPVARPGEIAPERKPPLLLAAREPGRTLVTLIPLLYGISGFVALALEVVWTRALIFSFFQGSSTYAFTTMLTIFLLGLGLGSLAAALVVDRLRDLVRVVAWGEIVIGVSAVLSLPALVYLAANRVHETSQVPWLVATLRDFVKSALVMLLPTLAMGALFPLMARLYVASVKGTGRGVGRLYFSNTAGAILGSFGAGFLLIPFLGMSRTVLLLGGVSVLLGVVLIAMDRQAPAGERAATALGSVAALCAFPLLLPAQAAFQQVGPGESLLFYEEGAAGTVAVVGAGEERRLQIDNVWIAGTNPVMMTAHKSLAHLVTLIHPDPKRVLTVGFASGGTSWSFTTHPNLESIDCVEIASTVLEARPFFTDINHGVLEDPRFRIVLEDARTYLLLGDEDDDYDIISTDCTDLRYKSDANLYTVEYFETCRRRLCEDGILVVFLPFGSLTDSYFRGVLGTFQHVFPEGTVWYVNNYATHYLLLVGSKAPLQIDWEVFKRRIAEPSVAADLAEVGLENPYKLLSCFVMDSASLKPFVLGYPLNSIYRPYVEFGAPRSSLPGALDNLESLLLAAGRSVPDVAGMSAEEEATLERYREASRHALRGHLHATRSEHGAARYEYEKALALTPGDPSLERILGVSESAGAELLARAEADPRDLESRYELALHYRNRGELDAAESTLRAILKEQPLQFQAAMSVGALLEKQDRLEEAWSQYQELLKADLSPEQKMAVTGAAEANRLKVELRGKPEDNTEILLRLAQLHRKHGDLIQAIRVLEKDGMKPERDPMVQEALIHLFIQAGMYAEAEEGSRTLLARDPVNAAAHYYLMDVYIRRGWLDRAEQEFEATRALDDTNPSIWFNAARLYQLQGRAGECTDALRRTLRLGGSQFLQLAGQDPVLKGSPSLAEVLKGSGGAAQSADR